MTERNHLDETLAAISKALPAGLRIGQVRYSAKNFGNWLIEVRRAGLLGRRVGLITSDRGQVLRTIDSTCPIRHRLWLEQLPEVSADASTFISSLGLIRS